MPVTIGIAPDIAMAVLLPTKPVFLKLILSASFQSGDPQRLCQANENHGRFLSTSYMLMAASSLGNSR
jgi:hypothetical protein